MTPALAAAAACAARVATKRLAVAGTRPLAPLLAPRRLLSSSSPTPSLDAILTGALPADAGALIHAYSAAGEAQRAAFIARLCTPPLGCDAPAVDAAAAAWRCARAAAAGAGGGGGDGPLSAAAAAAAAALAAERLRAAARPPYEAAVFDPILQHASGVPFLVRLRGDALQLLQAHRRRQRDALAAQARAQPRAQLQSPEGLQPQEQAQAQARARTRSQEQGQAQEQPRGQEQGQQEPRPVAAPPADALQLARLERDLRRLLSVIFSGGMLRLERAKCEGASEELLSLLARASVHPAESASDLRARICGPGCRVYCLAHPAMPRDQPLVALQVALCGAPPASMREVLGPAAAGPAVGSDGGGEGGSGGDGALRENGSSIVGGVQASCGGGGGGGEEGSGGGGGGGEDGGGAPWRTACFYSVQSTQPGLSGLDLGRVTILRAAAAIMQEQAAGRAAGRGWHGAGRAADGAEEQAAGSGGGCGGAGGEEVPMLVTLSPVPGFRAWLDARLAAAAAATATGGGGGGLLTDSEVEALLRTEAAAAGGGARAAAPSGAAGDAAAAAAHAALAALLRRLVAGGAAAAAAAPGGGRAAAPALAPLLERLAAVYLLQAKAGGGGKRAPAAAPSSAAPAAPARALDPVAHFHCCNGAALWRVNAGADLSEEGLRRSYGIMANYRYDLDLAEARRRRYLATGAVEAAPLVARLLAWPGPPGPGAAAAAA